MSHRRVDHAERECVACGCTYKPRVVTQRSCSAQCRYVAQLEQQRARYQLDPERRRALALLRKYGITVAEYERLAAEQNQRCKVCRGDNGKARLAVDHCHVTGRVRGLLCSRCNVALGMLQDNDARIALLREYLGERPASDRHTRRDSSREASARERVPTR